MERREMLVASGTVAATALGGCLGSVGDPGTAAQDSTATVEQQTRRKVIVSASGEAKSGPDLAVLSVAVEATGDTAGAVRDDLAENSETLRQALLDSGLDEESVTTSRFDINERVDRRQMEEDGVRPTGSEPPEEYVFYDGTHAFRVEVSDIDRVGAVIDTAVDGGADEIARVTFTLSDEKRAELREKALRRAIQTARSEAETIADEVGTSVAEATVVDTSQGQVSPIHRDSSRVTAMATESAGDDAASTGVEPGEVTVTADVRVQYRME